MLRKTVVARALSIAFSTAALTVAVVPPAMAQSNATGVIAGRVDSGAGASVVVTNVETGLRRTVTVETGGTYRATALPPGRYRVDLVRGGNVANTSEVDVLLGQTVDASFGGVTTVQVTGRRSRIDVTNATNSTVFTAKELAQLPVQQNLTAVVLLAPNTTQGDSAFGNTASFGGSGVSENSFYLNGFPITNPLSQLGSMELPFGSIQQASVMTGGFGAEFGRSIGGVMSITSKSGTNTWEAGALYSITPSELREDYRNSVYPVTGSKANAGTDGKLRIRYDNRSVETHQYGAYVGGPIIKDKLFMFLSAERYTTRDAYAGMTTAANPVNVNQSGWNVNKGMDNRWLGKIDWNITDNHRLEFTSAGNENRKRYQTYGYVLNPNNPNALAQMDGVPNSQIYTSALTRNLGPTDPSYTGTPGAKLNMARYVGNITDDLTVTAMYGEMKTERGTTYENLGANAGGMGGLPAGVAWTTTGRWPAINQSLYRQYNFFSGGRSLSDASDTVRAGRLDIEYKLGAHTIRAGVDSAELDSTGAGYSTSGGSSWTYRNVNNPNIANPLSGGRTAIVGNYGGSGAAGYYVRQRVFSSITDASSTQDAAYIEDRWQATKNLLLTIGVRSDSYTNSNGDGEKFIDMNDQIAPRFSAAWDVNGDASFKVFGSAGRYYLQLPTQVAARAASRSTFTDQDFTYTGVDPTNGSPLGLRAINTPYSANGEYGQKKNPLSVVSQNLKPNYQDEITLGFERAWSADLNFGGRLTYRKLGAGIDDSCDWRVLYDHARRNGIPVGDMYAMGCFIYNPGKDAVVFIDGNDEFAQPVVTGKGRTVTITAAELMQPKAKRTYKALDLFLEHPMRNGWYGRVNYTWSRSEGNMEGQTRSDTGQSDVGTSAGWDFPEFSVGADGLLPNDREHQLKAFGFYQLTPEITLGANALVQSGRPKSCLGTNNAWNEGTDPAWPLGYELGGPGYGPEFFFCGGKFTPRGSLGRMPTEKRLDLSASYSPALLKGLQMKVDVYNVFNSQTPRSQTATYDAGDQNQVSPTYDMLGQFMAPRSVRFTVEYNRRF